MRVVSPVAITALTAIVVQNLPDSLQPQPVRPPDLHEQSQDAATTSAEAVKPKPVQPTVAPETLTTQQFTGIQATLKQPLNRKQATLANRSQRLITAHQPLQSAPTAALALAATPEWITLPPLDTQIDRALATELKPSSQPSPPESDRSSPASDGSVPPNTLLAMAQPVDGGSVFVELPVADNVSSQAEAANAGTAPSNSTPELPNSLLDQKAAATGTDRRDRNAPPTPNAPAPSPLTVAHANSTQVAELTALKPDQTATRQPGNTPPTCAATHSDVAFASAQLLAALPDRKQSSQPETRISGSEPLQPKPDQPKRPPAQTLQITIFGEVQRPGSYVLAPEDDRTQVGLPRVIQALQQAGGVTEQADLRQVQIRRITELGTEQTIAVNLWEVLQTGEPQRDLPLQKGDIIFIPTENLSQKSDSLSIQPRPPLDQTQCAVEPVARN